MPYTYLITHKASNVKYYGVRYAKSSTPEDLGVKYFSSSSVVKRTIKEEGIEAFKFEVRKIFDSKEDALKWERRFLTKVNAAASPMWFNKHNGGLIATPRPKGYICNEHTRQKMRKPKSPEHRDKLIANLDSNRVIPTWSEERRIAHAEKMKGNSFGSIERKTSGWSEERRSVHREKMKGNKLGTTKPKLILACPHCGKVGKQPNMTRYHFDNCKFTIHHL